MANVTNKEEEKKANRGVRWKKQMKNNQTCVVNVAVLRRAIELLGKHKVLIKTDKNSEKS